MVDSSFNLSISTQCRLLSISKSGYYYHPKGESALNLKLIRLIDEIYLASPCFGSRQIARYINNNYDYCVSRKRIRRLMRLMGLCAIYQAPRTTISNQQHKTFLIYCATLILLALIMFGALILPIFLLVVVVYI